MGNLITPLTDAPLFCFLFCLSFIHSIRARLNEHGSINIQLNKCHMFLKVEIRSQSWDLLLHQTLFLFHQRTETTIFQPIIKASNSSMDQEHSKLTCNIGNLSICWTPIIITIIPSYLFIIAMKSQLQNARGASKSFIRIFSSSCKSIIYLAKIRGTPSNCSALRSPRVAAPIT